jgi:Arc/MetJ-type ribon-helix-helix transcriptional regulator
LYPSVFGSWFVEVRRRTWRRVCFANIASVDRIIYAIFNFACPSGELSAPSWYHVLEEGERGRSDIAMTITFKPEQERIIRAEIESGHFRSPDEVLDYALAALKEKTQERHSAKTGKNLAQFLTESPLAGAEMNLERQRDYGPPV